MADTANTVFRDYVTDGVPSSGKNKPKKREIRQLLTGYEAIINAFIASGGKIYSTKEAMDADLSLGSNNMAWVMGDPVAGNNGVYRKTGAPSTGSWIRIGDLPYSFIIASDVGAGTANAIQATTSIPVSGSALIWMNVFEANTASPVTVSFNAGSTLTIKTNSGNDVAVGGLVAGMIVMGIISGSTFRLVSDQTSAALLAQVEDLIDGISVDAFFKKTDGVDVFGSEINSARIYGRSTDIVNILDYATTKTQRESLKAGGSGFMAAMLDAQDDAKDAARLVKAIRFPDGVYEVDDDATVVLDPTWINSFVGDTDVKLNRNGAGRMFELMVPPPNVTTGGAPLTGDVNPALAAATIPLSVSDAAQFSAGQDCIIRSGTITTGSLARNAEFIKVRSVNYATGVVTTMGAVRFSYLVSASARLYPITLAKGPVFKRLEIDWTNGGPTSPQRPPYNIDEAFALSFCENPRFIDITTRKMLSHAISLHACQNAYVQNHQQYDGFCDGFDMSEAFSYGVAEVGLNIGLVVEACRSERSRHLYTTLTVDSSNTEYFNGGHPMFSQINNSIAREMKAAAFDTHGAGYYVSFNNCRALGARGAGFQLRAYGTILNDCYAGDILPLDGTTDQGHGVYLVGTLADDLFARDCQILGFTAENCYGAGVYDQSRGTKGRSIKIKKTNLPGIVASGTGAGDFKYSGVDMEDVAKSPGGLGAYAVVLGNAIQSRPILEDVNIDDPNNNLTALVKRNNDAVKAEMRNVFGQKANGDAITQAIGVSNTANMVIRGGYGPSGGSIGPINTKTIASDVLALDGLLGRGCIVLPESGVADTISTMTGGERDGTCELRGSTGNTITLTHSGGGAAGTLFLRGAVNVNLLQNQTIRFSRHGGVWFEDWRSF
jgi:hypothetical protein